MGKNLENSNRCSSVFNSLYYSSSKVIHRFTVKSKILNHGSLSTSTCWIIDNFHEWNRREILSFTESKSQRVFAKSSSGSWIFKAFPPLSFYRWWSWELSNGALRLTSALTTVFFDTEPCHTFLQHSTITWMGYRINPRIDTWYNLCSYRWYHCCEWSEQSSIAEGSSQGHNRIRCPRTDE